jgi:type II secretory pathway pseudopilin PulG
MIETRAVTRTGRPRRVSDGVVLLALLIALALGGFAVMAAVDVWSLARQRGQEQELLFVGNQYRQAIQRYFVGAPPGTPRVLPSRLEDLLEDNRFPVPVHHLRRLYPDPITGSPEWGVLRAGPRIMGIYSLSEKATIKREGFALGYEPFSGTSSYRGWLFAISPTGHPTFANPDSPSTAASAAAPSLPSRPVPRTSS